MASLDAHAQFAVLRGHVQDSATHSPLSGANVRLVSESETRGTATDAGGDFVVANVPPGRYVLAVTHVGYDDFTDTLDVDFGARLEASVSLVAARQELEEVVVESDEGNDTVTMGPGHVQIRSAALQRVPMPDVSADLMAFLVTRPGVVTTGDRGGNLFIRGGTPAQNLVLIDGMRIFQPFHIVGFYSVFPADVLAQADVYAGGFGARYGGRISSVIDVTTRSGSKEKVTGSASLAPFLASVRAEIPFVENRVSILASARESVIERIAPDVLGIELPYRFGDRFAKIHAYLNQTSTLSATYLHSFDEGDVAGIEGERRLSTWDNTAVGARYVYLPPDYPVLTELALYGTRYASRYVPAGGEERVSDVEAVHAEIRFAYLLGLFQLHFGLFGATTRMDYDLGPPHRPQRQNLTDGGLYVAGEWDVARRLRLEPGLRIQAYSSRVGSVLEPRLRASWTPGGPAGRQTFNAAWGIYHQQILGINNQRDVTDAFTAWAASPDHAPLPRSVHGILGWQRRFGPSLRLGAEAYRRTVDHVSFPLFDDGFGTAAPLERVSGAARGIDLTAEFHRPWLYLYAGYGLSAVEYRHERPRRVLRPGQGGLVETIELVRETFSPPHDRRHQLNLLAQIRSNPYRFSVRWQYGSGVPFTPIHGYFRAVRPAGPDDAAFHDAAGALQVSFADPYSRRLPSFHRLDVSAERDFDFEGWSIVVQAGLINVYDRENIFSYDLLLGRRVDQLPIIPSAGLRVELDR